MAAEQNPSEITTAAIAKRMKLTQGAIFRHFPSKDSIWQAVMEWLERLHAIIEEGKSQGEIVQEVDTTAAGLPVHRDDTGLNHAVVDCRGYPA